MYAPDEDEELEDREATESPIEQIEKEPDVAGLREKTQNSTSPVIINK